MQMSEIHDYASRLLSLHGDKARAVAAQRALDCETRGEQHEAWMKEPELWELDHEDLVQDCTSRGSSLAKNIRSLPT